MGPARNGTQEWFRPVRFTLFICRTQDRHTHPLDGGNPRSPRNAEDHPSSVCAPAWSPPCDGLWTPLQIRWRSIRAHQRPRRKWLNVSCGRLLKVSRMLRSWSPWQSMKAESLHTKPECLIKYRTTSFDRLGRHSREALKAPEGSSDCGSGPQDARGRMGSCELQSHEGRVRPSTREQVVRRSALFCFSLNSGHVWAVGMSVKCRH